MAEKLKTRAELFDELRAKFKALDETLWERRAKWEHVSSWINQFSAGNGDESDEQLQMAYLASHFLYFGLDQIRALLRAMYRDLFKYSVVEAIRKANSDTINRELIGNLFTQELANTRFLGLGNPSESGSHLLYYFRQENELGREFFIHSHEIFIRVARDSEIVSIIRDQAVKRYIFIDDLCGSGSQASIYASEIVEPIKQANPQAEVWYLTIFATSQGLEAVKKLSTFDRVATVVELGETFKCFADGSRIYKQKDTPFDKDKAGAIAIKYGGVLLPKDPLGYRDGQLLIGFFHNTPDNTLPIIWMDDHGKQPWKALFRRYPKQYGWES